MIVKPNPQAGRRRGPPGPGGAGSIPAAAPNPGPPRQTGTETLVAATVSVVSSQLMRQANGHDRAVAAARA